MMYSFIQQRRLTRILHRGKRSLLNIVRMLPALFASLLALILLIPSAPAVAAPALSQAEAIIDGVTVTVVSPVLPARQFSTPLPDQASQQAIMTSIFPYREISVLAVPLGTTAPFDGIAASAASGATTYRHALATVRAGQHAIHLKAPAASLFGQQTPGYAARVDLPLHGTRQEPAVLVEWVSEAGERIWVVRIVVEAAFAQMHAGGVQGFVDALATVRLTSTSLGAPSTLLQALRERSATTGTPTVISTPTTARHPQVPARTTTLPFPSWWNGNCDANAHGSPTSYPLGDSYEGMPACGPRPAFDPCGNYCDYPEHFFSGAWGELEWECVELVMRYLYLAYSVAPYSANGNQVVANYSGSALIKVTNGSGQAPAPGDVISFNDSNPSGHTALVASSSVSNGNGTIYILQQNFGGNGYGNSNDLVPMTVSGGVLQDAFGMHATGWLHHESHSNQTIVANSTSVFELRNDGSIWQYTGGANPTAQQLDNNPANAQIAVGPNGSLYTRHSNGQIWQYTGSGWIELDNNAATIAIAASDNDLYELHNNGQIWQYTGSGWIELDNNAATIAIAASNTTVYQLRNNGQIWRYTGSGWTELDNNAATVQIAVGANDNWYELHNNGQIWQDTSSGWQQLDNNPATIAIAASNTTVYQLHNNGQTWQYTGSGWIELDNNAATVQIAVSYNDMFYEEHADQSVWYLYGTTWQHLN